MILQKLIECFLFLLYLLQLKIFPWEVNPRLDGSIKSHNVKTVGDTVSIVPAHSTSKSHMQPVSIAVLN